ncbi:hypothetical protein ACV229_08595 [Burkholderia sp. MR1-5-21]
MLAFIDAKLRNPSGEWKSCIISSRIRGYFLKNYGIAHGIISALEGIVVRVKCSDFPLGKTLFPPEKMYGWLDDYTLFGTSSQSAPRQQ